MKLKITVQGETYEVDVEVVEGGGMPAPTAPVPAAPRAMPPVPAAPATAAAGEKACRAPIPGNVTQVKVKVGQAVAYNETVLVMEAMKMETPIHAPVAGTVKAVNVAVGDSVKQGQVMVELD